MSGFWPASNRRSFVLLGLGAILGLLLAGYSLFTARGTSTLIVPAEDVALVNQQPISRSDYLLQLKTLYDVDLQQATPEQRRKVLDDMIREELFVQRGKELDVAAIDPDVRSATVNAVELEIAADAITAQPSEPQLRAYFAAHRTRYASEGSMSVQDFVFAPDAALAAGQAAAALRGGAPDREVLARLQAFKSGKLHEDEFYFAAKIHLGESLFDVARRLHDGEASSPVPTPEGIHVLWMAKNNVPVPFDFDAARDQVLTDYRNDAVARLRSGDETFLRKRANVLIADDLR